MKATEQSIFRRLPRTLAKLGIALLVFTTLQVLAFKVVNPPFTVNMVYEWVLGNWFGQPYVKPVYLWQDLNQISVHLKKAVMASEDQRFLDHQGFDFYEIKKAFNEVMNNQGFRGASTISMQAARSLFLPSSRSLLRKAAEAWYTILMELFWDKNRILEVYLNTVDWGTGVVGAQSAARAYFGCDARQLRPAQAALMAAVLPSPHKWSATSPGPYVRKRQAWIMSQMPAMPRL